MGKGKRHLVKLNKIPYFILPNSNILWNTLYVLSGNKHNVGGIGNFSSIVISKVTSPDPSAIGVLPLLKLILVLY